MIGAGSGGVRAARLSAMSGARVLVAEEDRVGGTCVIRGCVPKKFMVYASEVSHHLKTARGYGWTIEKASFDWPTFLADKDKEIAMRRRLPQGVRMYTGDDFNYAELIEGDAQGYSDALLGIFDAIAPAASAALGALARGEADVYHRILAPTVPLSRFIFKAPTRFYKTGVVFMAYLNGLQKHFIMVGGQESARSALHLAELFRLADAAGLLVDPDRAAARMRIVMAMRGVVA